MEVVGSAAVTADDEIEQSVVAGVKLPSDYRPSADEEFMNPRQLAYFRRKLLETWEELPPIFITSSAEKKGRDEILKFIVDTNAQWGK